MMKKKGDVVSLEDRVNQALKLTCDYNRFGGGKYVYTPMKMKKVTAKLTFRLAQYVTELLGVQCPRGLETDL